MLEEFLVTNLFAVLLIFTRVGAGLMAMPGFGETYVTPRQRLIFALAFAVILAPLIEPDMPPVPDSPFSLMIMLFGEMLVGASIGIVCRMLIASIHVAGMAISYQSGLAMATQFDVSQASQGSIIGSLISLTAVVVIFTLDLHHVMLLGLAESYITFLPGAMPPVEDFTSYITRLVADVFRMGIILASPSIVIGLLLYLGAGMLARLMPNVQIFFIIMPPQIFISFFILMSVFTAVMLEFVEFYSGTLEDFLH